MYIGVWLVEQWFLLLPDNMFCQMYFLKSCACTVWLISVQEEEPFVVCATMVTDVTSQSIVEDFEPDMASLVVVPYVEPYIHVVDAAGFLDAAA